MAGQGEDTGKAIVLFSDGTGNSSGKLFRTNVWRLYEAVDLGTARDPADRPQIAYYDNGVGTSSIKILAMLTGVFGLGLKRNVLEIYRYACRNYRDGDDIYAFGFSRGAFTIRIVLSLICEQGIVRYGSERELMVRSLEAFRRFNSINNPNFFPFFAIAGRAIRNLVSRIRRRFETLPPPLEPYRPDIAFIGVWDTVTAYGGPFTEITRAIDNWIWPLSMTDYHLSPKVMAARHALSLDDRRDAFHPLLWDEFKESRNADAARLREAAATDPTLKLRHAGERIKYETRLQQVWFAGMHADVGGGYPDESLSFVSLCWMMEGARSAGLRLLGTAADRVREMSNSYGPIHDSRTGFGAYYRFQPRKISAYLHPESQLGDRAGRAKARIIRETLSMRDPTWGEQEYRPQGMLLSCKVHESVIARITFGTDDYAPITLPDTFQVVPAAPGVKPPAGTLSYDWDAWKNIERHNRTDPATGISPRGDLQETIWDDVLRRRLAYFATLLSTLAFLTLPQWVDKVRYPPIDGRWFWGRIVDKLDVLLPDWLDSWLEAIRVSPLVFIGLIMLIWGTMAYGASRERRLRDGTRDLWRRAMAAGPLPKPAAGGSRWWRNSYAYQWGIQNLKWRLLPNVLVGPLLLLALAYPAALFVTQVALVFKEYRVCSATGGLAEIGSEGRKVGFETWQACNYTGAKVDQGHRYGILFIPTAQWSDGGVAGSPAGIPSGRLGLAGTLGAPFRRVVHSSWLHPLLAVRPRETGTPLPTVYIDQLRLKPVEFATKRETDVYWGAFDASQDGELFLFANEAGHPVEICYFYASTRFGNRGTADVVISDLGPINAPAAAPTEQQISAWMALPRTPVAVPAKARRCKAPAR